MNKINIILIFLLILIIYSNNLFLIIKENFIYCDNKTYFSEQCNKEEIQEKTSQILNNLNNNPNNINNNPNNLNNNPNNINNNLNNLNNNPNNLNNNPNNLNNNPNNLNNKLLNHFQNIENIIALNDMKNNMKNNMKNKNIKIKYDYYSNLAHIDKCFPKTNYQQLCNYYVSNESKFYDVSQINCPVGGYKVLCQL